MSPYVCNRGAKTTDIPRTWWQERGGDVVEMVLLHFHVDEPFVFGELSDLDLLARDIWKLSHPERERAPIERR